MEVGIKPGKIVVAIFERDWNESVIWDSDKESQSKTEDSNYMKTDNRIWKKKKNPSLLSVWSWGY